MADFTAHDLETAPDAAKPLLEKSKAALGRIPGLHAVMAESPQLLEGYQVLHRLFAESDFDADEKTVVWQAINVEHVCHYCVPAHTGIARMMGVDDAISDSLRNETALPSPKLEALRTFTLAMLRGRGHVDDAEMAAFFDAGYDQRAVLNVILALAQKVMSNYTNHVAETPVDQVMQKFAWSKAA
ncbi:carboxymuconolactone decarboxylase family protein [Jannaschia sp. KMU-145]|uniref:carboxymuconolactone decarboxylase family protein n=1 Tax=Jannaschia halovivens TaxID=3388667 RepID=UPI00396AF180